MNEFINAKKNSKNFKGEIKVKDENFLGRFVKSMLNPTPLNLKFRKSFNLNENYRLVYLIENERLFLITHNIINLLFPVFFLFVGVFIVSELTGRSQMSKSFEHPYQFISFLTIWFSFAYFLAKRVQSATIFRIYYNQKENKFAFIRLKGLFKFDKEDFTKENVILRFGLEPINQNKVIKNLTKNFGNVYINNRLRQIDYKLFSSEEVMEKMFGKKNVDYLRSKSKI